ncbi:MAG: ABC transporter substrate-binding protein [Chloroflexi bacterium]|nr:ABC transporter substrate-binding protein [Chloroflexota bacterium]
MVRLVATTVIVATLATTLGACAPAPTPTPQVIRETVVAPQTVVVEKEKERIEVRLSGWAANPQETALLESLLYKFSVANPDIIVKYEPITGDYWAAMSTMVAAGQEPDIYYMDIFQFLFYATKGVLVPLDEYMAKDGVKKEDFVPTLINAFTYQGKVYGIPKDFNTLGLFYNKKYFAEAGLEAPTDDWTWDDMKAAARALSKPDKGIYGLGVPADAGRFPIFVFQNGGHIMNADFTDTLLDSPEAIAAAEFYTGFRADKSGATPADVGDGWQGTSFGKGTMAMVFEGGWLIPYLKEQFPDTQYGVVVPPAGPKGEGNLVFTVAYVISKNCKNPEAAWKVINFLTNKESQTTVLQSGFALPSRAALADDPYFKDHPDSAAIFKGAEFATPFMWGLHGSDVNDQMSKALERVYLKGQSPADALKEAANEIRKILAE